MELLSEKVPAAGAASGTGWCRAGHAAGARSLVTVLTACSGPDCGAAGPRESAGGALMWW